MFGIKKRIPVMQAPRFFAAYSTHPFIEEKDKARYPDYAFEHLGGMYWCIRIGDINVPFGFGKRIDSFRASGLVTLSRRNVSAATVDGLGLPRVQVGEIDIARGFGIGRRFVMSGIGLGGGGLNLG